MSSIDRLLENIPLPRVARVRQNFESPVVKDPAGTLTEKLRESRLLSSVEPGMSIAVAVGSRGVANIAQMTRALVAAIAAAGGRPFVFPAMGSHGGATAEGQVRMLASLGVTEEFIQAPIRATMDVVELGETAGGMPVYLDGYADRADGIVLINRIKPHTSFRGDYESGLMKMITIGMGKQRGADICHAMGMGRMAENIPAIAKITIAKKNILCAVGVLENAYHETARIEVMAASEIADREPPLLGEAWRLYPRIPFEKLDVLILDEIGKNISGTGFDTNVVGRFHTPYASGGPDISRIAALDITDESHGNGIGLGILDFTTRRAYEKFDFEQTYPNALTSTVPTPVKIPMVLKNDRQAIQAAVKTCNISDLARVRLVRIKNTLELETIYISSALRDEAASLSNIETIGDFETIPFDGDGDIFIKTGREEE